MIRRLLKSSGILSDKKKHSGSYSYTSQEKTQQQFKDDDVIEADYRVID